MKNFFPYAIFNLTFTLLSSFKFFTFRGSPVPVEKYWSREHYYGDGRYENRKMQHSKKESPKHFSENTTPRHPSIDYFPFMDKSCLHYYSKEIFIRTKVWKIDVLPDLKNTYFEKIRSRLKFVKLNLKSFESYKEFKKYFSVENFNNNSWTLSSKNSELTFRTFEFAEIQDHHSKFEIKKIIWSVFPSRIVDFKTPDVEF